MNKTMKIVVVVVLIAVVGIVIAFKQQEKKAGNEPVVQTNIDVVNNEKVSVPVDVESPAKVSAELPEKADLVADVNVPAKLPLMVDLGADKCIPCKMMKPILDELKQNYKERLNVVFIDVWKNPSEAEKYKVNIIPTQIFYDSVGKELFRHQGFYSKEDIIAKWKEFNINIEEGNK